MSAPHCADCLTGYTTTSASRTKPRTDRRPEEPRVIPGASRGCRERAPDVPLCAASSCATPSFCHVVLCAPARQRNAESGAELTSLSQEAPAHSASLRDVLNALQDCGMRFADVWSVAR